MATVNGAVVTYNLFDWTPYNDPIVASVISVDATATALHIVCPSDALVGGSDACPIDVHLTVGPWAQPTPPPDTPEKGSSHLTETVGVGMRNIAANEIVTNGWNCELTSTTVPTNCYLEAIMAGETTTHTYSEKLPMTQVPITITAGMEKLGLTASPVTYPTGATLPVIGAWTVVGTTYDPRASQTSSPGAAATATASGSSNAASSMYGVNTGTLGLVALAAAFFVR